MNVQLLSIKSFININDPYGTIHGDIPSLAILHMPSLKMQAQVFCVSNSTGINVQYLTNPQQIDYNSPEWHQIAHDRNVSQPFDIDDDLMVTLLHRAGDESFDALLETKEVIYTPMCDNMSLQ